MLLWSLSGALHPLMSRYQPQPVAHAPPAVGVVPAVALSLAELLARHGIESLRRARVVRLHDALFYQVVVDSLPARYFALADGSELADGERRYAAFLAGYYTGTADTAPDAVETLASYTPAYPAINRLLPVARVRAAGSDGLTIYVETHSSALATLVDRRKAFMNTWFLRLHTWRVFAVPDALRVPLAAAVVGAAFATPLLGIALWRRSARPGPAADRRLHRRLGLAIGLILAASAASGAYHLLHGAAVRRAQDPAPLRHWPALPRAALDGLALPAGDFAELGLVVIDGAPYWRARAFADAAAETPPHAHAGHAARVPTAAVRYLGRGALPAPDDATYARALAAEFSGRAADGTDVAVDPVVAFGDDYGFINKRLPVERVSLPAPDAARWFVHLESATLAARVDRYDYLEGWIFAHLHKWQWLEKLAGRWPRDLLQIACALAIAATATLGLRLFLRAR